MIARRRVACAGLWAVLLLARPLAAQEDDAAPQAAAPIQNVAKAAIVSIPVPGAGRFGSDAEMRTLVYKPAGDGPFPVLLYSHGRTADAVSRAKLARPIPTDQVSYWLAHGFAVVAPIRPGYGASGGADVESAGARIELDGRCVSKPDFTSISGHAVRAIQTALGWVRVQPWADARRIVLEGQSVGGFATVATAAAQPDGVVAYVNFAGGAGGDPSRAPGRSCDPDQLGALYAGFGRTTRVPNVWIYAANDQYWGADAPKAWHAAFAAGGSATRFIEAPPVADGDGHGLSRHPAALWSGYLDDFLRERGIATGTVDRSR